MALTAAGIDFIAHVVAGQATPFDSANAHIGIGDGTIEFDASHTDLTGFNRLRKNVDEGYPTVNPPVLIYRATFDKGEANFAWNEWALFNARTGGTMLNRVVEANGVKQEGQTWVFEVAITFTVDN